MEYRGLTLKNLRVKAIAMKKSVDEIAFEIKSGELSRVKEYRKNKKDLARILTVIKEKELGIEREVKVKETKTETKTETKKEVKKEVKKMKETKVKTKTKKSEKK